MARLSESEQALLDEGRKPTLVVEDLHVKYRSYATGRKVGSEQKRSLIRSRLRGTREVHALKGASFVAFEGESIGVIGHNGSGKSTMFSAISGLIPTADGHVWGQSRPALLGVNAALLPELSGEKNIQLGGLALGLSPQEVRDRRDSIVEFSALEEHIDRPMRTYSSGMSARLRFAIAASVDHSILLIDEALAVGDRKFRRKSEARIQEMRESAGTVMIVSHSMTSILNTCTRVIWLNQGEIMMNGDPQTVIDAYHEWTNE